MLTLVMPAAPRPCSARPTASIANECDNALTSAARLNTARPDHVDAAIAEDVAERSQRQQRYDDGELISVDDPDRLSRARADLPGDCRQRDVGDRAVEHRHDEAGDERQDRPIALRKRKSVFGRVHRSGRVTRSGGMAPEAPISPASLQFPNSADGRGKGSFLGLRRALRRRKVNLNQW